MKFIFEDDERDIISVFFRQAYPNEKSEEFIYARGNANIEDKIKYQLENTVEEIVVFLDMVPGNREIIKEYRRYSKISRDNGYRVIILPIVCAEYYLIKSLKDTIAVESNIGVDICINKDVYFDSPLIQSEQDKVFCRNFEKYCKLILIKNMKYCASHSGKTICDAYGAYYLEDCICRYSDDECRQNKDKIEKAVEFIREYPCVPNGSYDKKMKELSLQDVWSIHKMLVDEFNQMNDKYMETDVENANRYKHISEIK